MDLSDRVMGSASRPEPVGARFEIGLEDRLEHRLQGSLNHPVADRWNPEATEFPSALGDLPLLDRQRPKGPRAQLLVEPAKERLHAHPFFDVAGCLPVNTG